MTLQTMDRRFFIQLSALGTSGLVIGCGDDGAVRRMNPIDATSPDMEFVDADMMSEPEPSRLLQSWIRITEDERVYIAMHKGEMGQGVHTSLPLLVAEELDVSPDQVEIEIVPEIDQYLLGTGLPLTYGSTSVRNAFMPLRRVGAAARAVLVQAAALRWDIAESDVRTENGVCISPNGERLTYGELVPDAQALTPPDEPILKPVETFKLIGKDRERFADADIVEGRATYGIDARPENCLYAAIRHAPTHNGTPQNVADLETDRPGVTKIVELPHAIAVIADSFWTAKMVVESLPVEFSTPEEDIMVDSGILRSALMTGLDQDGNEVLNQGDIASLLNSGGQTHSADYFVPPIAHVPMEPVNATVHVRPDEIEVWAPTQGPQFLRDDLAELFDVDSQQVTIHPLIMGGSYGRKSDSDYVIAAALIAREVDQPVQLIWSREEDIRRDAFRPCFGGRMTGFLDDAGALIGWIGKNCGDSVLGFGAGDPLSVQGLNPLPYSVPNQRAEHVFLPSPIPSGSWRSIGHSQNTFFVESFIDEMAHLAQQDPYIFRRTLLADNPRSLRVLERVSELSDWGAPQHEGAGQGIALCDDYGSYLAAVCEASVDDNNRVTVHRISVVVDCGLVVQPAGVLAQIEGGILFGLSAALHEEITLEAGRVTESNLHDYEILSPREVPVVQVEIIESDEAPGGVGELSVGPAAPALANAIFQATGVRCRTLPIRNALNQPA